MEDSILTSTKKILGIAEDYTAFDLDIITHINGAFSTLAQLGVGPLDGFVIDDKSYLWEDITNLPSVQLGIVKIYVYLKTRMLFDPPATSFHIQAAQEQLKEYEWRLANYGSWLADPVDPMTIVEEEVII